MSIVKFKTNVLELSEAIIKAKENNQIEEIDLEKAQEFF